MAHEKKNVLPWQGNKTEAILIRVTPQEKRAIQEASRKEGGVSVSRYLITLHHKKTGTL